MLTIFWRNKVQNNIYFFCVTRKHFCVYFALGSANLARISLYASWECGFCFCFFKIKKKVGTKRANNQGH